MNEAHNKEYGVYMLIHEGPTLRQKEIAISTEQQTLFALITCGAGMKERREDVS
jgi:hypothetical protein